MSYLRNDGDILIDAVLTDEGRLRLSKGDGSFRIAKFALGDDEIDYGLIDMALPSATRDLVLLGTPVMEAFTNNAVALRSKLLSNPRTDLLYLPIIELNTATDPMCTLGTYSLSTPGTFVVCVDQDTENEFAVTAGPGVTTVPGVIKGAVGNSGNLIRVDQGLDTTEISPLLALDGTLVETQYEITMDSRLGSIVNSMNGTPASVSYVDDDLMATYILTLNDRNFVSMNTNNTTDSSEIIAGPRGTTLKFRIKSSIDLAGSDYLFTNIGGTVAMIGASNVPTNALYIDSLIRIVGLTTGYTLDIPVRFVKLP